MPAARLPRALLARLPQPRRRWAVALVVTATAALALWVGTTTTTPAAIRVGPVTADLQTAPGSGALFRLGDAAPVHADVGAGPLELQMHVRIRGGSVAGVMHEPELLHRLSQAKSSLVGVALGYLGRLALHVLLVALVVGLVFFRRRWRLVVTTGVCSVALLGTAVGATAMSMRAGGLSTLGSGSCARGWAGYVLPDLDALSRPVPPVVAPAAVLPAANAGLVPVELVSDDHLNPVGLQFALRVQEATQAAAVLDAGDTTSFGVAGEGCVVQPWIRRFHVPYVWVRGNHDSRAFQQMMRSEPGVRVLDDSTTTVAGITVYGLGDPAFTPRVAPDSGQMRSVTESVVPRLVSSVTALAQPPDVVLVHDCRMAVPGDQPGAAGLVPLVLCGHTHHYAESSDRGTTVLHTGTVGAGGLAAPPGQWFTALVLYFAAKAPHRLVSYWVVTSPGGPTPAAWLPHLGP